MFTIGSQVNLKNTDLASEKLHLESPPRITSVIISVGSCFLTWEGGKQ